VYRELHRIAHRYMLRERQGRTLQTCALVNEAYLRLVDVGNVRRERRTHFFAVSARIMRRILVDAARERAAAKRGGSSPHVDLDEVPDLSAQRGGEILALENALQALAKVDPRKAEEFLRRFLLHVLPRGFVRIRYFGILANRHRALLLPLSRLRLAMAPLVRSCDTAPTDRMAWHCPRCHGLMAVLQRPIAAELRLPPPIYAHSSIPHRAQIQPRPPGCEPARPHTRVFRLDNERRDRPQTQLQHLVLLCLALFDQPGCPRFTPNHAPAAGLPGAKPHSNPITCRVRRSRQRLRPTSALGRYFDPKGLHQRQVRTHPALAQILEDLP
jgi:hypothetical protein